MIEGGVIYNNGTAISLTYHYIISKNRKMERYSMLGYDTEEINAKVSYIRTYIGIYTYNIGNT